MDAIDTTLYTAPLAPRGELYCSVLSGTVMLEWTVWRPGRQDNAGRI